MCLCLCCPDLCGAFKKKKNSIALLLHLCYPHIPLTLVSFLNLVTLLFGCESINDTICFSKVRCVARTEEQLCSEIVKSLLSTIPWLTTLVGMNATGITWILSWNCDDSCFYIICLGFRHDWNTIVISLLRHKWYKVQALSCFKIRGTIIAFSYRNKSFRDSIDNHCYILLQLSSSDKSMCLVLIRFQNKRFTHPLYVKPKAKN